jgi:hypothetical protein
MQELHQSLTEAQLKETAERYIGLKSKKVERILGEAWY